MEKTGLHSEHSLSAKLAADFLSALKEVSPNSFIQGSADYVIIDGRFNVTEVANIVLAAKQAESPT